MPDTPPAGSRPLTIVIATWTVKGADSGIKTYLTELVRALQDIDDLHLVLLCEAANRRVFEPLCRPGRATIRQVALRGPASLRPLSEQVLARRIDTTWGDVLIVPSNVGLLGARLPQIVINQNALTLASARPPSTVRTGQSRAHRLYFDLLGPRTLRKADAVVAVTEWMRDQVLESVPDIDPARVHVVFEGARVPDELPQRDAPGPHCVLFASSLWPYKGANLLIDALAVMRRNEPDLDWHCRFIGKDPSGGVEGERLVETIKNHGLAKYVEVVGNVAFDDIWQEYVNADVLAYPSLLESFGLPPLEAMACGTPVVASNIPSVTEVVDDAALIIDPHDADAFATALTDALTCEATRERLVEAGHARALELTWATTARRVAVLARNTSKEWHQAP